MELILKEWLGVNELVKLDSPVLAEVYAEFWIEQNEEFIKNKGIHEVLLKKKYIGKENQLYQAYKSFNPVIKNEKIKEFNEIFENEAKSIIQNDYISKPNLKVLNNEFLIQLNEINEKHKEKFKKQGEHYPNPICEIYSLNGEYCVKTYQYVGEFELKTKSETLKIKIQTRNLVSEKGFKKMVEVIFNIQQLPEISGVKSANSVLFIYYLAFLCRLKDVLNRGIYREYVEMEENLNYLKERLLIPEHIRYNFYNKHKLYCGFTEFSSENIINETILETLQWIKKSSFSGAPSIKQYIRQFESTFSDIEIQRDNKFQLSKIRNIKWNRQNQRYKEIIDYCANILQNLGGSFGNGNTNYKAFYLDMNLLFEQYVGKLLKEHKLDELNKNEDNHHKCILKQNDNWTTELQNEEKFLDTDQVFKIKPDILIKRGNNYKIVADTKYKRLIISENKNYGIHNSDVYQVMAYAKKFNVKLVYLIYPRPKDLNWVKHYKIFEIDDIKLIISTIDIFN